MALNIWAMPHRVTTLRPHVGHAFRQGEGWIIEFSALGFAVEAGAVKPHTLMAHEIDQGRRCCRYVGAR